MLQDANVIISQITSGLDINIVFEQDGLRSYLSTSNLLVTKYGLKIFPNGRGSDNDFFFFTVLWI